MFIPQSDRISLRVSCFSLRALINNRRMHFLRDVATQKGNVVARGSIGLVFQNFCREATAWK